MSVQKKSLISQRSAVKSAILATPETSNSAPTVRAAARPPLAKPNFGPKISPKQTPRVAPPLKTRVSGKVANKLRGFKS
jgi:hypothetical protein